jgi:hypothetical protein
MVAFAARARMQWRVCACLVGMAGALAEASPGITNPARFARLKLYCLCFLLPPACTGCCLSRLLGCHDDGRNPHRWR